MGRWQGVEGEMCFLQMPRENVVSQCSSALKPRVRRSQTFVLSLLEHFSAPQSAGQLLEEHFSKRMMQHSEWPWGLSVQT